MEGVSRDQNKWKVLAGIRGHGRFSQGLKYIDIGKAVEVTVNSKE
jgi:hypothetical protein